MSSIIGRPSALMEEEFVRYPLPCIRPIDASCSISCDLDFPVALPGDDRADLEYFRHSLRLTGLISTTMRKLYRAQPCMVSFGSNTETQIVTVLTCALNQWFVGIPSHR